MLSTLLLETLNSAKRNVRHTIGLKGGLIIQMMVENECVLHLTIARKDVPPSLTEWETVLKYFPWPVICKPQTRGNSLIAVMPIHPKFL